MIDREEVSSLVNQVNVNVADDEPSQIRSDGSDNHSEDPILKLPSSSEQYVEHTMV